MRTGHPLQFQVQSWLWNISLYTGSESGPVEILYNGLTKTTLTKKNKQLNIYGVFFLQVLSKLTLTAIKIRLDKIDLFPHLLTRVDGLNAYLRLMHKCPDIFENVDFFSVLEEIRVHT